MAFRARKGFGTFEKRAPGSNGWSTSFPGSFKGVESVKTLGRRLMPGQNDNSYNIHVQPAVSSLT